MIAELQKNQKFVRFFWLTGTSTVNIQNYDSSIPHSLPTRSVDHDIDTAREKWTCLVMNGFKRVPATVRGVATDHINFNSQAISHIT